ncbi:ABC transporter permease protein [Streptococcus sp. DD11]|uniref:FtsX-like permease family protein n=1 Tax=Streptococcus sp. DD11 TaxID=1777879 RepID=UPI00079113DD|nr:FtsX-like permease family protein [Streptococcus sp. DD11]KXT82301.1 ABC transporter permease protein [Streptococcus sp. DD11]
MSYKTYWKDIRQSFRQSKGRVISIASLMALGSFALVGLKVTGPNIRTTGEHYFRDYQAADLAVISDYGLSSSDQQLLDSLDGKAQVEYSYMKDAVIKDTSRSVRILSASQQVSKPDLVEGKLPSKDNEIALTAAYRKDYQLGQEISFTEKAGLNGKTVLRSPTFKIVGFVNSVDMISNVNLGKSTAGTGELDGYGVVAPSAFDSDVYMVARIRYKDLSTLSPYSQTYIDKVYEDKKAVEALLAGQPQLRLNSLKTDANSQIQEGENKIADVKRQLSDASQQLQDGQEQISQGESQLAQGQEQIASAENQLASGASQLADGQNQLASSWSQLQSGRAQLDSGWAELNTKKAELDSARTELDAAWTALSGKKAELDSAAAQLEAGRSQLTQAQADIDANTAKLTALQAQLEAAASEEEKAQISQLIAQLEAGLAAARSSYEAGAAALAAQTANYEAGLAAYQQAFDTLNGKEAAYQSGLDQYQAAQAALNSREAQYQAGLAQYQAGSSTLAQKAAEYQSGQSQLAQAQATLAQKTQELADAKKALAEKTGEYDEKKAEADKGLAEKEKELADAKEKVRQLGLPTYNVYSRREVPGSEGYVSYENNSNIIDAVGNIFPVVLYFVAALVTFTTMARFVDEERIKAGTFKALGYDNQHIIRKFVIYGLVTSMTGTVLGITAGHLLLPTIIYNTYGPNMSVPKMELHFYPWITLLSILLALLSAVLPAYLVARKELTEKPAQLLLPKPPASGSKILLERIRPIWSRLSFTQKVTARNIFRYKQRMLMTIFGVCGSIALLFGGLGIRSSIADLNTRQFGEIIKYDMIVAKTDYVTDRQAQEIDSLLDSASVRSDLAVHYEEVSKIAGKKNDQQKITLLTANDRNAKDFSDYIALENRENRQKLSLDQEGAIISEKLASLTKTKIGDELTVQDANGRDITVKVSGITEMYMGHFIFMNNSYYKKVFRQTASDNAYMVKLKDGSSKNTDKVAADFMELSGVKGIVQNTILKEQVNTIVNSLNKVMYVLIISSVLLAIVILYNLTNINVAERLRELSTIKVLGFFDKEVTLYIYRETIYLSLIGILAGFASGLALHAYMTAIIPPDAVMFNPAVGGPVYLFPTLVVVAILTVLGFVVNHWLKRVDMLEALKSVE